MNISELVQKLKESNLTLVEQKILVKYYYELCNKNKTLEFKKIFNKLLNLIEQKNPLDDAYRDFKRYLYFIK